MNMYYFLYCVKCLFYIVLRATLRISFLKIIIFLSYANFVNRLRNDGLFARIG